MGQNIFFYPHLIIVSMKRELPNKAEYDSAKSFLDQSAECQQYFFNIMNNSQAVIINDNYSRPLNEIWRDTETNLTIIRISEYHNEAPIDWSLISQTININ